MISEKHFNIRLDFARFQFYYFFLFQSLFNDESFVVLIATTLRSI